MNIRILLSCLIVGTVLGPLSCGGREKLRGSALTTSPDRRADDHKAQITIPDHYIVALTTSAATPVITQQNKPVNRFQRAKASQPARDRNIKKIKGLLARSNIKTSAVRRYYADVIVGFSATLSTTNLETLKKDPDVKGVYPDVVARFGGLGAWQTFEADEFEPYHVENSVSDAGGPLDGSRKSTYIWILDTGIDLDHPDLNVQTDERFAISVTSDSPEDKDGHGTLVAGMAAAKHNEFGTSGVSSGATVVPVKVSIPGFFTDDEVATLADILSGLDHVAQNYELNDVVNISWGYFQGEDCATTDELEVYRDAIRILGLSGVWVVSGSGNDTECEGATIFFPACVDGDHVLTVGGFGFSSSNFGRSVDWVANGRSISTYPDDVYAAAEGTSLSAPVVAGIIHLRGGPPVSSGRMTVCGATYKRANVSELSLHRFDVDLELDKFILANVSDWDGTEDLYGHFELVSATTEDPNRRETTLASDEDIWSRSEENPVSWDNGTHSIGERISVATNISFNELRHIELTLGGQLFDDEGFFGSRNFTCQDCRGLAQERVTRFINNPTTLASINNLEDVEEFQELRFGEDTAFEMNYYESNNRRDGWVRLMWKVFVKPKRDPDQSCNNCHRLPAPLHESPFSLHPLSSMFSRR